MKSELHLLVEEGIKAARLMERLDIVNYVGHGIDIWERHGLVTKEQRTRYWEALLEAGTQLGTSFVPDTRSEHSAAAKGTGGGYGTGALGGSPRERHPEANARKSAALKRRAGHRAAARRAGERGQGAPVGLPGRAGGGGDREGEG